MPEGQQFRQFEAVAVMDAQDRIRAQENSTGTVFEVGLHVPVGEDAGELRSLFAAYAAACGFSLNQEFDFQAGRLLFVPVEGERRDRKSVV